MVKYLIIIEKAKKNYSAYSPDLPGCAATGATKKVTEKRMKKAIEMHIRGLLSDNLPLPRPQSTAEYVRIN